MVKNLDLPNKCGSYTVEFSVLTSIQLFIHHVFFQYNINTHKNQHFLFICLIYALDVSLSKVKKSCRLRIYAVCRIFLFHMDIGNLRGFFFFPFTL